MAWKNWGDHPVVVAVGVLAGLAGFASLAYTLLSNSSIQQKTGGNNSPNINASKGDVRVTFDNSTTIQAPSKPQIPNFSGEIGNLQLGKDFTDFISNHDAQIVYLDVYFEAFAEGQKAVSYEDDWFILYTSCRGLPENQPPNYLHCFSVRFDVRIPEGGESLYGHSQRLQYLRGYWSIRANRGLHQGRRSVTLTAVDTKDVNN
ncbi:MAG: hypothetical protein KME13_18635 [Myxacorys californica WJT36-NPBG1]|jgi:hypothetical protein|nr:hypothetical protein [Myxacorys californica WJT36-NPBG1]